GVSRASAPSLNMKTRQKQLLEVLSAYQAILFFLLGLCFPLLFLFSFFTRFWFFSLLYLAWLYLDWDTPFQGGRRSEWLRRQTFWNHLKDYYPIKLVKTQQLPADQKYVIICHPHGIMSTAVTYNFTTENTGFSQLFPGLRVSFCVLNYLLYIPGYREYLMLFGICSVSPDSLDFILSRSQRGQAVAIVVGGAHEALYAISGSHCLTLRNRKGFIRLALRHGASLVPTYSFGENDIFKIKAFAPGSWQFQLQVTFRKFTGFPPCIFWGRSLFSAKLCGLQPFAKPLTTVVGQPIPVPRCPWPSKEQVDHYHMLYMKALEQLFEEHKESCGVPASAHLTFI
uniref:Acyltransferase n=1 Tax=Catagonus wagneri TaxID=51154 RepID=A0A8C3WTD0_9CETA